MMNKEELFGRLQDISHRLGRAVSKIEDIMYTPVGEIQYLTKGKFKAQGEVAKDGLEYYVTKIYDDLKEILKELDQESNEQTEKGV